MKQISKYQAQISISRIWLICGFIFVALFMGIALQRVTSAETDQYTWLITYLSPGLTLIVSSLVYSSNNKTVLESKKIDNFFVRLLTSYSLVYFICLSAIVVTAVLADQKDEKFYDHINSFSLLLNFLQTILLSLLGIFFVKDDSR